MNIAIYPNLQKSQAAAYTQRICEKLTEFHMTPMMLEEFRSEIPTEHAVYCTEKETLLRRTELILTVGGDGTILHAARDALDYGKPLVGVNCGRLGFLAALDICEIDLLERLRTGDYELEPRMLLDVTVCHEGDIRHFEALNDVVVSNREPLEIVELGVEYNGKSFCDYRADGLIFSTPTGSTAYSLSAGGPIIDPQTNCILMTPICPHSLLSRSVLFSESGQLQVRCRKGRGQAVRVTVDGDRYCSLEEGGEVRICKAKRHLQLIQLKSQLFYQTVTDKFIHQA